MPAPTSIDAWAGRAFDALEPLAGVIRVGLVLPEGAGRRLLFTATERRSADDLGWCHIDGYDDVPLNAVLRTGTAIIGSLDELDPRYAGFTETQRAAGLAAIAAVPVAASGRVLGGFILYFDQTPDVAVLRRQLDLTAEGLGLELAALRPAYVPVPASDATASLRAEHDVAPDPAAVAGARRFLRRTLAGWEIDDDTAGDATLCLSELVTNALLHTHGGCRVRVELEAGVLTTRIHDSGTSPSPQVETAAEDLQVHGHGLELVEALANRWGRTADDDGAEVWFALDVG